MRLFPPDIPWFEWRTYRAMYRSRGAWWPSMGTIACLAVLFLSFAVGDPLARVVTQAWLGLILLMCVLCGVALVGAAGRAVRATVRLGLRGWSRSRWWFEWANLAWSLLVLVFLIAGPLCALALKVGLGVWGDWLFWIGSRATAGLFWAFVATAAMGYVVSTLSGRPRIGNAYGCVQLVFPTVGGMILVSIAALHWPAANPRGNWLPIFVGGCGAAIIAWGIVDVARALDRQRARRHPAEFE